MQEGTVQFMKAASSQLEKLQAVSPQLVTFEARMEDVDRMMSVMGQNPEMSARTKVRKMLINQPENAGSIQTQLWYRMKPLNERQISQFWSRVESAVPLFDAAITDYQEWEQSGDHFFGMCHKITGKAHGIVR